MNASKWSQAEEVCKENLAMVNKLANYRAFQKMRAYKMVSVSLLNQDKFKDALEHFNRALKFSKSDASESDPELAELLVMIGLTHSKLGDMGKARDLYEKGEKILQLTFDASRNADQKFLIASQLKKVLQYHISAAEADGAAKEAALLKTRLAGLL
jgi:tetratricopeptide (TPR) repeat protein